MGAATPRDVIVEAIEHDDRFDQRTRHREYLRRLEIPDLADRGIGRSVSVDV